MYFADHRKVLEKTTTSKACKANNRSMPRHPKDRTLSNDVS